MIVKVNNSDMVSNNTPENISSNHQSFLVYELEKQQFDLYDFSDDID